MLMKVVATHGINLLFQLKSFVARCCDRGCKLSAKNTKQLTQADYEDLNTGDVFMLEYRYSNLLTVMMVTMMYGSGIPILYFIAFIFYVVTYWMDSFLLFNFYRKPLNFDKFLAESTLRWFKLAILLHVLGGAMMFSNSSILPIAFEQESEYLIAEYGWLVPLKRELLTVRMVFYIGTFVGIFACWLVWRVVFRNI
jgi:hypothetical protein